MNKSSLSHTSYVLLTLSLFLITLTSHSIYSGFIGFVLLVIYSILRKIKIRKPYIIEVLILLLLLVISVIRFQTHIIHYTIPLYINAFIGNLFRYIYLIASWFILRHLFNDSITKNAFKKIIPILLGIHVFVFILQFFTFLSSGFYIDLLEPFTGEASRYRSFDSSLIGIGSFRPTGFYNEPSTYFFAVLAMLNMLILSSETSKYTKLIIATIITMFLSFSTAAIIIATLLALYLVFTKKRKFSSFFMIIIGVGVVFILFQPRIKMLLDSQKNKYERTSTIRIGLINYLINEKNDYFIIGTGAFAVPNEVAYASTTGIGDNSMASINDSGMLVSLMIYFGLSGIAIFVFIVLQQYKYGKKNLILFLLLSLTKISFSGILFVFYLAFTLNNWSLKTSNKEI